MFEDLDKELQIEIRKYVYNGREIPNIELKDVIYDLVDEIEYLTYEIKNTKEELEQIVERYKNYE